MSEAFIGPFVYTSRNIVRVTCTDNIFNLSLDLSLGDYWIFNSCGAASVIANRTILATEEGIPIITEEGQGIII